MIASWKTRSARKRRSTAVDRSSDSKKRAVETTTPDENIKKDNATVSNDHHVEMCGRLANNENTDTDDNSEQTMFHLYPSNDSRNEFPREEGIPFVVNHHSKESWRNSLTHVREIAIPNAPDIRPMKTMNVFVTKATVFLAYLIVNAEINKPLPKLNKKFEIDFFHHRRNVMMQRINFKLFV